MNEEGCYEKYESCLLCELYNGTVLLKSIKGGGGVPQLMTLVGLLATTINDMGQLSGCLNSPNFRRRK